MNYNIWNCFFLWNCINKYQLWHLPLNIQIECQSTRKKIERQSTRIYFYLFGICDILNSLGLQTKYLSTQCSLVGSVLIDSNGIQIRLLSSHPIQRQSDERCVQSDFKGIALNWSDLKRSNFSRRIQNSFLQSTFNRFPDLQQHIQAFLVSGGLSWSVKSEPEQPL